MKVFYNIRQVPRKFSTILAVAPILHYASPLNPKANLREIVEISSGGNWKP